MTDQLPPQPETPPPPAEPPVVPAPPDAKLKSGKNHTNAIIIGSAAAVIAAIVATGVVVVQSRGDSSKPAASTKSSATTQDAATTTAQEPDPTPTYAELDANSFTIKLKTKSRQCFGSAGCNLTVEPDLTYLGVSESINPDATYEITYEIRGDESGPVIETAELSNQTSLNYTPTVIQTASSSTKVSVEITDVAEQGG
ncbi:hypothetical protein ACU639_05215 [Streptomyces cynarae]|uniref:hypothetical protein n=1 Tax=Streptomyces cynarae TaxID=2981134 RepID=UPI00406C2F17